MRKKKIFLNMANNVNNLTPTFTYQPSGKVLKQSGVEPDPKKTNVKKQTQKKGKKPSEDPPKAPRPTGKLIDTTA